jgi:hypothetical protein
MSFHAPTTDIEIVLKSGGDRIALEEQRVLPQIAPDCAFVETVFLRPVEPLEAGKQYTLDFESRGDAGANLAARPATFTTGDGVFEATERRDIEVTYLHVSPTSECAGTECEVAEVMLSLAEPTSAPYWLAVETRAANDNRNRVRLSPSAWFTSVPTNPNAVQASVVLPRGVRCVEITVYGLDGMRLLHEERCEPDGCALFDRRDFSDCGDPVSSSLDVARVPPTTCDDPYVVPHDRFGNATYDAGTADSGIDAAIAEPDSGLEPIAREDAGTQQPGAAPQPMHDAGMDASAANSDGAGHATESCSVRATRGVGTTLYAWLAIAGLAWRRSRREVSSWATANQNASARRDLLE